MILQALTTYYDRLASDGKIAPEGLKRIKIPFIIVLDRSGRFVRLQDTREPFGKKLVARAFLVPKERERSGSKAWETANLLWDHYGYVLGYPKSNDEKSIEMARKQHSTFTTEVKKIKEKYPRDVEIGAVYEFLSSEDDYAAVFSDSSWEDCLKISGCNLTFRIDGINRLVCENENVRDFIASSEAYKEDADDENGPLLDVDGVCLVTGGSGTIERLHPRTPIRGSKSNAKIVSFQRNMGFDSYGKEQSYNAPISKKAAFSYTTALNQMLAIDSRQKLLVGDATAVFWAEKESDFENIFADLFGEPAKENTVQINLAVNALFASLKNGVPPIEDNYTKFFVLGLAPNAARIAVRFWHAGTVGEIARNVKQHFDDCSIVRGPRDPEHLSLFRLLVSTAMEGKADNIQPNLSGEVMKAILADTPYPMTLLSSVIRRIKAEREITYPRVSIVKAVLERDSRFYKKTEKEVSMSLDPENKNMGYLLGRLFAVLERAQESASPGINATIRDRFYGAASSTPVAVFPHLMKLKVHHIAKIDNRGTAVNLEKQIGGIIDGISDFPAHLNLKDQGRFAVGYYHQRQSFFMKKENQ